MSAPVELDPLRTRLVALGRPHTAHDVAEVFSASLPTNGTVVVAPGPYVELFREVAPRDEFPTFLTVPAYTRYLVDPA